MNEANPVMQAAVTQSEIDSVIMAEIQLLLAEKRTSLAALRTGIAIFAFPLSILSLLIATSKSYEMEKVLYFLIPLLLINLGLIILAIYLILRALRRIRHYDHLIDVYKQKYTRLADLLG